MRKTHVTAEKNAPAHHPPEEAPAVTAHAPYPATASMCPKRRSDSGRTRNGPPRAGQKGTASAIGLTPSGNCSTPRDCVRAIAGPSLWLWIATRDSDRPRKEDSYELS